jgi:hypothetical protein
MTLFPASAGDFISVDHKAKNAYTYFMDKKRKIITIVSGAVIILILGFVFTMLLRINSGYLTISEWDIKLKIPNTITDVRYKIIDDTAYFVAKPKDANVDFPSDLDDNFPKYSMNWIERSNEKFTTHTGYVDWRENEGFYYVIGGSGNTGIFGDADLSGEYQASVSKALEEMFETFQPKE